MEEDIKFLQTIYKNAKMGVIGIENIIEEIEDKNILKVVKEQRNDYYSICTKAIKLLSLCNAEKEDITKMVEVMSYMDAKLKLIKDNSTSNIAKMMIEGNNMGIVELQEQINKYEGKNKNIKKLAKQLLDIESKNLENLKKYL